MQTGISANTLNRMVFDAGALYRNYGLGGQQLVGATRGGATFSIDKVDREVEVDGAKGPIKGLRRTVHHACKLEVKLVEMTLQTFVDVLHGTVTTDGIVKTITPTISIVSGDYYTNIALVADVSGTSTPCVLSILNALWTNGGKITTNDKNEGELAVTIEGHYDPATLTVPPYLIKWPVGSS